MCPEPDPISNSAVKHTSAHGTVSQDTGESVAARPAQHKTHIPSSQNAADGATYRPGVREIGAGWSSPVARQAHNLKVAGSNPAPATKHSKTRTEPAAARTAHTRPHGSRRAGLDASRPRRATQGPCEADPNPRHAQAAGPSPAEHAPRKGRGLAPCSRLRGHAHAGSACASLRLRLAKTKQRKIPVERPIQRLMLHASGAVDRRRIRSRRISRRQGPLRSGAGR